MVPDSRLHPHNDRPLRPDRDYVLYWMIATRRTRWSFAMDRAAERARELGKPLLVFEPLRAGYRWASDRHHRFVLDGMRDNERALEGSGVAYYPYVEPEDGAGSGLLEALARRAAVVVTDEFPCFFLPRMVRAAADRLDVRLEAVDSCGLLPLAAADRAFFRAYDFRRHLQRRLDEHLEAMPSRSILAGADLPPLDGPPADVLEGWPRAAPELLAGGDLSHLPIDHSVGPAARPGGYEAGRRRLRKFLDERLARYADERNDPCADASSGLSPYLHFGHVSAHQVLDRLADREGWTPVELAERASGARRGWWGMSAAAEAFLDQLVTWREVGYGFCHHRADYGRYSSLPDWALETLAEHAEDERPFLYDLATFEDGGTHDTLWNAAQTELARTGSMHNYLRMLWGKKILHWTESPRAALDVMLQLNDKYALDGRDPNSYSGIFWVLGRFDRAWGPEREIFGKVRYMSSRNTRRKLRVGAYVDRWSVADGPGA